MIQDAIIKVGMADMGFSRSPGVIRTSGLGSCIGMTLYDPVHKVGGMVHIMLPSSHIAKEVVKLNKSKYADTAIPELIRCMTKIGASVKNLQAKLVGGSEMFSFIIKSETMRIGHRNAEGCKQILAHLEIPIISEDIGGNYGRTIELHCDTGLLIVRTVNKGVKEL